MAKNLFFSVADPAWAKLRDLPEHKHRAKSYQQFDGHRYVTMEPPPPSAKGLGAWLTNFLFNRYSPHHSSEPPYSIMPESFVDAREWALSDYEMYGMPGGELNINMDNFSSIHSRKMPTYTTWNDGSDVHQHGIQVDNPLEFIKVAQSIVEYWHISLPGGYFPRPGPEMFSSFLNAFGMGYLSHPSLTPEPLSISENIYYKQLDARMAKAKEIAEAHREKEKEQIKVKRVLCRNQFEYATPTVTTWVKCSNPAEYTLFFATQEIFLCQDCLVNKTKNLPVDSYKVEIIDLTPKAPAPIKPIKFKLLPPMYTVVQPVVETIGEGAAPVGSPQVEYAKPIDIKPLEQTPEQKKILQDFKDAADALVMEGIQTNNETLARLEEERRIAFEEQKAKLREEFAIDFNIKKE